MMNPIGISVALICAGIFLSPAHCQKTLEPAPTQLQVVVRADHDTYHLSDTMRLETRLVNAGEQDVYVWNSDLCWNPAHGLSLHFIAPDGTSVRGKLLLDDVPPPPVKGDPYQFFKLEPNTFHGRVESFKISDLVESPGEYHVEVTFSSFLSRKWVREFLSDQAIGKLPLWTMSEPVLKSSRIRLRILP